MMNLYITETVETDFNLCFRFKAYLGVLLTKKWSAKSYLAVTKLRLWLLDSKLPFMWSLSYHRH